VTTDFSLLQNAKTGLVGQVVPDVSKEPASLTLNDSRSMTLEIWNTKAILFLRHVEKHQETPRLILHDRIP
jgi:hypothetical protein